MKNKNLLLTILSGVLTVLAWRESLNLLVWAYLIPLLVVILSTHLKKIMLYLVIYSSIVGVFGFLWVRNYNYYVLLGVFLVFTLFHIGFGVLTRILVKRRMFLEVFIPPIIWIIMYYIFDLIPVDNFWINISALHAEAAPLIWYVGSLGITFIIILFSSSIAFFILRKKKAYLAVGVTIIVVMSLCFLYSNIKKPEGETIKAAVIQGNFPESWEYRTKNAKAGIYETYKNLTYESLKYEPDLIAWPEYAIPTDILKDENFSKEFIGFTRELNTDLVLGSLSEADNKTGYDVALVFQKDSEIILVYKSVKPAPYEEDTKAYTKLETLKTKSSNIGIVICYEETQPELIREHANNGAEFFIALSNNNRFGKSNGIFLSSLPSKAAAAENGKYLIRATNTGISQIINPYGKAEARIEQFKRGILIANIHPNNTKTFYTKYGNILLNIFIGGLILLLIIYRTRKSKTNVV